MNFIVRSDLQFASRWLFAGLALMSVVMMVSLLPIRAEIGVSRRTGGKDISLSPRILVPLPSGC